MSDQTTKTLAGDADGRISVLRASLGGALMGLANLVPGISGGTMLVACGVYERFIEAVSGLTRLQSSRQSLLLISVIVVSAVGAIAVLAGVVSGLLLSFRWGMYSIFMGLAIGGVPMLWRLSNPRSTATWTGAATGLAVMIGLVVLETLGPDTTGGSGFMLLVLAGVAGAAAMILPGISGAYLLLVLGQYETIINSIDQFVSATTSGDVAGATAELAVLIPVGLGVVIGIAGVANVLRFVLHRYRTATIGVLLGLLVGAPTGLYPFREGVKPSIGELIKGQVVTEKTIDQVRPKDWQQKFFTPSAGHVAGALGLIVLGASVTVLVGRMDKGKENESLS